MFAHHYPKEVSGETLYCYFELALLLRRYYRHGVHNEEAVTCHVLAIVLAEIYEPFSVVHGGVWGSDGLLRHQHSWLAIQDSEWIIDVKPVHCITLSPLLLYVGEDSVFATVYEEHRSPELVKSLSADSLRSGAARLMDLTRNITKTDPITREEVLAVMEGYIAD